MLFALLAACGPGPDPIETGTTPIETTSTIDTYVTPSTTTPVTDTGTTDTGDTGSQTGGYAWDTTANLTADLTAKCGALLFLSESDRPLVTISSPGAFPADAATIADAVRLFYVDRPYEPTLDERAVEEVPLSWFFDPYLVPEYWWTYYEQDRAAQWQPCRDVFDRMEEPRVFRLGEPSAFGGLQGAIDVFVVGGSVEGDLVGVWTVSVKT